MADQTIQYTEEMVGAGHPTKADTLNRALLIDHGADGQHTLAGFQGSQFAADGEANDTYVITLDPAPAAYFTGMMVVFSANTANTEAATLNVNALGAKTIKKNHDQDLVTGDIESGQMVTVVYDGTYFQMQSPPATTKTIDLQNGSIADISDTDTLALTFAFVPSKIELKWNGKGAHSNGEEGATFGFTTVTITGTDTITSVMHSTSVYDNNGTFKTSSSEGNTSELIAVLCGHDGASLANFLASVAGWVTATKTLTLTFQETDCSDATLTFHIQATAYA